MALLPASGPRPWARQLDLELPAEVARAGWADVVSQSQLHALATRAASVKSTIAQASRLVQLAE